MMNLETYLKMSNFITKIENGIFGDKWAQGFFLLPTGFVWPISPNEHWDRNSINAAIFSALKEKSEG